MICKSKDWFLHNWDLVIKTLNLLRHKRVLNYLMLFYFQLAMILTHFRLCSNQRRIYNSVTHWTLLWWRSISYRNKSIDLLWKSMNWFVYDKDLRRESWGRIFLQTELTAKDCSLFSRKSSIVWSLAINAKHHRAPK